MAASELVQLRQRHTVSGLRYAHVFSASLNNVLKFSFEDHFHCSFFIEGERTEGFFALFLKIFF